MASAFGGSSGGSNANSMMMPLMLMASMQAGSNLAAANAPAPPQMNPVGSPSEFKKAPSSFAGEGSFNTPPAQQQVANKTLLGA